jgi:hypothetical protein
VNASDGLGQWGTSVAGDSGTVHFAYVDGVWFYVGNGQGPGFPNLHTVSRAEGGRRDQWASWIYSPQDDRDGDGIHDRSDSCLLVPNANACDTDRDGYGNQCDGDFDQNGAVDAFDFGMYFIPDFTTQRDAGTGTDANCDGAVNAVDFGMYFVPKLGNRPVGNRAPGPSGLHLP